MLEANLTEDETRILNTIRARQILRSEDTMNLENFAADVIDGRSINLERGKLGLVKPSGVESKREQVDVMALLVGEEKAKAAERPATVIERAEVSTH